MFNLQKKLICMTSKEPLFLRSDNEKIKDSSTNTWPEEAVHCNFAKEKPSTVDQHLLSVRAPVSPMKIVIKLSMKWLKHFQTAMELSIQSLRGILNMTLVWSVWISYGIEEDRKGRCVGIAKEWMSEFETLEKKRIKIDEKWFFFRAIGTKRSNKFDCPELP